jgi:hypothetical protein
MQMNDQVTITAPWYSIIGWGIKPFEMTAVNNEIKKCCRIKTGKI